MKADKGFGLIAILVLGAVMAVLITTGFLLVQEMQRDSDAVDANQGTSTEQASSEAEESRNQAEEEWVEYRSAHYEVTFEHPADWAVEEVVDEGFEDRPNILINDTSGQLVLGLYGHRVVDEDCDELAHDADPQPNITVGGQRATVMEACEDAGPWIGAETSNDKTFIITADFIGQPNETKARQILDSLTGVYLPIIN